MATHAQVLVQIRSSILRDLAGARAQLSRIRRGVLTHTELSASDLAWLSNCETLLLSLDEDCRKTWGYRAIRTPEEWCAKLAKISKSSKVKKS